ncbi:ER membrane complex subunit 3 [Puccinia graminis f. sp. tritici]|uniref:ER membrane protein complex subunit 3 n=1 Tax=Puccinia graminis f. sp. tritici TaxID=56615 RepID=A0A5B0M7L9_PUCGR|nr:ER membrane complex subunit 3 [Puccinia graminis f. sp. tritici]
MDISWVSSLSWYFLNLFGLNPLYRLILGDGNAADGTALLAMGGASNMAAVMPGQQVDYKKLYQTEVKNLKLVDHQYVCDPIVNLQLDDIKTRILKMYKN